MKLYKTVSISNKKEFLNVLNSIKENDYVFISLHVEEEIDKNYVNKCIEMCAMLNRKNAKIIADVSYKTLKIFNVNDFIILSKKLSLFALRIDYGLSLEEIIKIAKNMNVVVNASTMKIDDIKKVFKVNKNILAMHNYYPRKETGLDLNQYIIKSKAIKDLGIKLFTFINGDVSLRGPIYEGLPTLEKHRDNLPHVSFIELDKLKLTDGVFIGDLGLSKKEENLINAYIKDDVVPLKVNIINKEYLNKIFTCREDSPSTLIRIKESREYATKGKKVKVNNTIKREIGSITLDNYKYKRYSGELMIVRENLNKDDRVNVIGHVSKKSISLLKYINNGDKFLLYN